jgi:hypothetical protein
MKRYSLTSTAFEGEVIFEFGDNELLVRFDATSAILTDVQHVHLLKNMPPELFAIKEFVEKSKTTRLEQIVTDVTFLMFWERYNEKIRSSKKKAEKVWNRLPLIDRDKAYKFIQKYEMSLLSGTAKKYAETYLGAELWNN